MDSCLKDFKKKEQLLHKCLAQVQNRYISDFKNHTEETYLGLQNNPKTQEASIITYNDYYRKLMSKLMTISVDKNTIYDLCNYVIDSNKKTLQESNIDVKTLKLKFDEICKYELKSEQANSYYEDPLFCSYVASKTFKKTAIEVFEFMYYAFDVDEYLTKTHFHCSLEVQNHSPKDLAQTMQKALNISNNSSVIKLKKIACDKTHDWTKNGIRIASIGGGPGNDCLALYTYLLAFHSTKLHKNPNCNIKVYDLNHNGWKESHQDILQSYFKGKVKIEWDFTDHQKQYNLGHLHADFISICWTLNENLEYNCEYWDQLVRNNMNAIFIIVEGERKNTDLLADVFEKYEFRHVYYEKDANPRKLIAHY